MYVNVGARYGKNSQDIPTKKALKAELAEDPTNVTLYDTSIMGADNSTTGDKLADGVKYTVTGPNPYTNRKWYATVERKNGKIVVS